MSFNRPTFHSQTNNNVCGDCLYVSSFVFFFSTYVKCKKKKKTSIYIPLNYTTDCPHVRERKGKKRKKERK